MLLFLLLEVNKDSGPFQRIDFIICNDLPMVFEIEVSFGNFVGLQNKLVYVAIQKENLTLVLHRDVTVSFATLGVLSYKICTRLLRNRRSYRKSDAKGLLFIRLSDRARRTEFSTWKQTHTHTRCLNL